jgi:hypothetical protein
MISLCLNNKLSDKKSFVNDNFSNRSFIADLSFSVKSPIELFHLLKILKTLLGVYAATLVFISFGNTLFNSIVACSIDCIRRVHTPPLGAYQQCSTDKVCGYVP